MTDLRKLSEAAERANAEFLDALKSPGSRWEKLRATKNKAEREYLSALDDAFRSGSLIPRSEYERVLALLAAAREAMCGARRYLKHYVPEDCHPMTTIDAACSGIDDALAAEPEAKS